MTAVVAARTRWSTVPLAWRRALVAAVVLRVALAVGAVVFGGVLDPGDATSVSPVAGTSFRGWVGPATDEQGVGLIGAGLERQDALWYLAIARDGYPPDVDGAVPGAAAFFPLYPVVVGVLGRLLGGSYLLAANLASLIATVAALAGVHRLVETETGDTDTAGRALFAAAIFPTAFFLVAPFTESLFLALTAWAFVWARRGAWGHSAWLGALAGATRNVGVLMVLGLGLEARRQLAEGRRVPARAWLAALAPVAGLGVFLGGLWLRMGTPLAPFSAQGGWQREFLVPWETLSLAWRFGVSSPGQRWTGYHTLDLIVFAAVVAAIAWLVVRAPLPYAIYSLAHVAVWLVYPFPPRPLMSTPRFALSIAPLFWAIGALTRRRGVAQAWWGVSAALLGVHALLFVTWYFVF